MKRVLYSLLLLAAVTSSGCGSKIFEPVRDVFTVFENNTHDVIHVSLPTGKDVRLGPGDTVSWYAPVSEESTVRWTYPDGSGGRAIRFRPDAELGDANGADTWIYATGRVIR